MALKRTLEFLQRNPSTIAWVIAALAISGAFYQQNEAAQQRKKQICITSIEDRIVLRDIVKFAFARSQTPEAIALQAAFLERIEVPPTICKDTGVDVVEMFQEESLIPTLPVIPGGITSTTTTVPPPGEQSSGLGTTPSTSDLAGPAGPPGPVGPPGPRGPVSPDRYDPPPSTTTSTTTTTTTTPSGVYLPPITIPLRTGEQAAVWWSTWSSVGRGWFTRHWW